MAWNDNKRPVEFTRYRRALPFFGSRFGWFFHVGDEKVSIPTAALTRLLKEKKAYLVIDKDIWQKLVSKYRGEKDDAGRLVAEREAKKRELVRLAKELKARTEKVQKAAPKDAKKAAKGYLTIDRMRQQAAKLQNDISSLQRQIDAKKPR